MSQQQNFWGSIGSSAPSGGTDNIWSSSLPNTPSKQKSLNPDSKEYVPGGAALSTGSSAVLHTGPQMDQQYGCGEGLLEEEEPATIGVDLDLQEELVNRQKWLTVASPEDSGAQDVLLGGTYKDLIAMDELSLVLPRPGGSVEHSSTCLATDPDGKIRCIHSFAIGGGGGGGADEDIEGALSEWRRLTNPSICPFAVPLEDAFTDEPGTLHLVYRHDGGAVLLADLLHSVQPLRKEREREAQVVELWAAQLIWTVRMLHEAGCFAGVLASPQNILVSSQLTRLSLAGLGATQIISLARSPLPYSPAEIRAQQQHDLKALGDLVKSLLAGSRRWMVRNPRISPIIAYLDRRSPASSAAELAALPCCQSILQKLFLSSFQRQSYLEDQMMIQTQSERALGLLCKLNFVAERFEKDEERFRSWPSRKPLLLLRHHLFGSKNAPQGVEMDLLHVVAALRLIDSGSEERILLVSADASTSLVVSFSELGFYLEEAFQSMLSGHHS